MAEIARLFPLREPQTEIVAEPAAAPAPDAALLEAARLAEALIFAATAPIEVKALARRLPEGSDVEAILAHLKQSYAGRGINLVRVGGAWTFRTASDLAWLLAGTAEPKKLSRAAMETLAIIAYHQPVTRAEIEDIRGVAISKGTLDVLLETGWVRLRGRRRAPGRPITYGTTDTFLFHFGIETIADLPGLEELKGAGLFEGRLPNGFAVPHPDDSPGLTDDEDPLEDEPDAPLEADMPDPEAGEAATEAERDEASADGDDPSFLAASEPGLDEPEGDAEPDADDVEDMLPDEDEPAADED